MLGQHLGDQPADPAEADDHRARLLAGRGEVGSPASARPSMQRAASRPSRASSGVSVRPMAVTICQKAAVSPSISPGRARRGEHDQGRLRRRGHERPASAATALRAPFSRRKVAVTSVLRSITPTTCTQVRMPRIAEPLAAAGS